MVVDNFYTTYNARHLAPQEVAESFIWSDSFGKLIQNNHSIILGARGCGKTTLMKMLTLPALNAWKSNRAIDVKDKIPFYGIYISTDIYWNVKNQTYGSQLESYGNLSHLISKFSVNSNVFTSLCDTFINILSLELQMDEEEKEVELCQELIKAWKLNETIPKLKYIKEALSERVDKVNQFVQEVIFNHKSSDDIEIPDFFSLSFETSLEVVIPKFERIYNLDNKKKWALCFDELEFAPNWLREKLFSSLRSRTQYFLYKLSSSPILPSELKTILQGDYGPTSGNDVQLIKMWASEDNEEFSKKIIQSLIKNIGDANSFFGTNDLYNKRSESYIKDSVFYKSMKELIEKDNSFKDFLANKNVDIEEPKLNDSSEKNTLYRKIKPIVFFRNAFIESKEDKKKVMYRGRKKAPDLYYGIEVLTKICDGNPRWLIGIVSQLLIKSKGDNKIKKVDQYNEILRASKRFKNVIANIPVESCDFTIVKLLDRIGNYFRFQILGDEFHMDPKGTFIVNDNEADIPSEIIVLIEKAVAQGALILLDSKDDSFDFKIREQRFKLSYLFAVLYDLPLRVYSEISLSECLNGVKESKQTKLFG